MFWILFIKMKERFFLDEKCMENVQDIRKNICIRVAVEIYTRFLTLFAICIPKRRITNCTRVHSKLLKFAEKNITEIAPSLHFVMFKRQPRCNSCSYILITFNKIIFFCMQFK